MSRVIAYRTKSGKINYAVIGDDVKQLTLVQSTQGYERQAGVEKGRAATLKALQEAGPTEYMTRAEYLAFLRGRRK
jgi:hypothetical protein